MAEVLIVDDQDRYAELCRRAIPEHRYRGPARTWAEAEGELERARGRIDLVLLDVHFALPADRLLGAGPELSLAAAQRREGIAILGALRKRWPDLPVVLMTSRDELSLEALPEDEEYTYFLDDDMVDAQALRGQIESILSARRGDEAEGPIYWGRSPRMRRVRQRLAMLARGRLPVMILGPTGTGKSLLARHFVHARSGRAGRFVAVDLSTVPHELCAAHLFGSVKGAYTGSVADRVGAFEAASGGTLFLDEVGNLSSDAQKMLLGVLQEGTITRVGDLKERPVDAKLVVATNEDLRARVDAGTFRADLFMRLNPATAVELPPLVERDPSWPHLLAFAVERAVAGPYLRGLVDEHAAATGSAVRRVQAVAGGRVPDPEHGTLLLLFGDRALRALADHPWPGNLREFAMVVENAVSFALAEAVGVPPGERPDVVQVRAKLVRDLLLGGQTRDDSEEGWPFGVVIRPHDTLNKVAVDCERQYFFALWRHTRGDFGKMAQVLLGSEEHARKVQLRFNQLGLKVRDLRDAEAS
ncbi:MAG: sigma 54-interacting transcriptional regulator [Myxococcota bacterium]